MGYVICPACHGRRRLVAPSGHVQQSNCPVCHGTGTIFEAPSPQGGRHSGCQSCGCPLLLVVAVFIASAIIQGDKASKEEARTASEPLREQTIHPVQQEDFGPDS